MAQGSFPCEAFDVKQALKERLGGNALFPHTGLGLTDKLLVQIADDVVILRLRGAAGQATCPAVYVRFMGGDPYPTYQTETRIASSGSKAIAAASILLVTLLLVGSVGILAHPLNPYAWLITGCSAFILPYIWLKAQLTLVETERASEEFLSSLIPDRGSRLPQPLHTYPMCLEVSDKVQLPQKMPDEAVSSLRVVINRSQQDVVGALHASARKIKPSAAAWLGISSRAEFAVKGTNDGVEITRIRPTNSSLFKMLVRLVKLDPLPIHFFNLDFGPTLKIRVLQASDGAEAKLLVTTSLLRKIWMIANYTLVFPFSVLLIFSPWMLLAGLCTGDMNGTLVSLFLTVGLGGSLWTLADMDSSDRTEFMHLTAICGELLEDATHNNELAPLVLSDEKDFPSQEAAMLVLHKKLPIV